MTVLDGWAYTRWGAHGMLNAEAALGMLGIVLFVVVLAAVNKFKPAAV